MIHSLPVHLIFAYAVIQKKTPMKCKIPVSKREWLKTNTKAHF